MFLLLMDLQFFLTQKNMNHLGKSFEIDDTPTELKLRNSTNFLHSQLIRNSLSRNSSLVRLRQSSTYNLKKHSRVTSLHKIVPQSLSQHSDRRRPYHNLKHTLEELEEKIGKAKQILVDTKKSTLKSKNNRLVQEDYSISEIEDTFMKKSEDIGFDFTQNSTKFFSFSKNDSKLESTLSQMPKNHFLKASNSSKQLIQRRSRTYYLKEVQKMQNGFENQRLHEHLLFSLKIFHSLNKIQAPDYHTIQDQKICLLQNPKHRTKKTLLLDIDETLLHCEQIPNPEHTYDFILQISVSEMQTATAYISLRPYALTFLKNMVKYFEIIAFTASHESYADVVLNEIDPDGQIFSHRLYRSSCYEIAQNLYTKDLRMINRRLESTVLVDNSPYSYIFQLENGIPILPYHYGPDRELPELQKYLEKINDCVDVRELNKQTFKFHHYLQYENVDELLTKLYIQK